MSTTIPTAAVCPHVLFAPKRTHVIPYIHYLGSRRTETPNGPVNTISTPATSLLCMVYTDVKQKICTQKKSASAVCSFQNVTSIPSVSGREAARVRSCLSVSPTTRLLLSDLHILELGDEVRYADARVKLVGVSVCSPLLQLSDRPAYIAWRTPTSPQAR